MCALALSTDRKSKWNSYYAVKQCMFCMFSKQIRLADMNIQHAQFSWLVSSRLVSSLVLPLDVYMILHMLNHNGKTDGKHQHYCLVLMLVVCTFFNPKSNSNSNSNCQLCECWCIYESNHVRMFVCCWVCFRLAFYIARSDEKFP